jgi:methylglutaconyl-CoA hydratase
MVMALLRRAAGEKVALDLVLTGRVLSAQEAERAGLVSRVCADGELESSALQLAGQLGGSSGTAIALTKQLFYQMDGLSLNEGIARGAQVNAVARQTPDFRAAIARFLKR